MLRLRPSPHNQKNFSQSLLPLLRNVDISPRKSWSDGRAVFEPIFINHQGESQLRTIILVKSFETWCPDKSLEPFLVTHDGIFVQVVNIPFNRPVVFDSYNLEDERLISGRLGELLQALHKVALLFALIVGCLVTFFKGVVPEVFVEM